MAWLSTTYLQARGSAQVPVFHSLNWPPRRLNYKNIPKPLVIARCHILTCLMEQKSQLLRCSHLCKGSSTCLCRIQPSMHQLYHRVVQVIRPQSYSKASTKSMLTIWWITNCGKHRQTISHCRDSWQLISLSVQSNMSRDSVARKRYHVQSRTQYEPTLRSNRKLIMVKILWYLCLCCLSAQMSLFSNWMQTSDQT